MSDIFHIGGPCLRQNNMDLCCLANNFNKKLLIGDRAASLWARSTRPKWVQIINVLNCWLHWRKFVQ